MLKVGDIVTRGSDKGTVESLKPLKIRKYGVQPIAYFSNPVESEWMAPPSPNDPKPLVRSPTLFGQPRGPDYGTGRRRKSRKTKRKTRRHRR
jgi:hypothetical protein